MRYRPKTMFLVSVCVTFTALLLLLGGPLNFGQPRTIARSDSVGAQHSSRQLSNTLDTLKSAIRNNSDDPALYYDLGKIYLELHDLNLSIRNLSIAIQLKTNEPAAYDTRGLALFEKREFSNALLDFNKCLQLDPKRAKAYNNRGLVYLKLKKTEQAIEDFTTASNLSLDSAKPLIGRATAYRSLGRWSDAADDLKLAVTREPDDPFALNALAWIIATCPDRRLRDGAQAERFARKACDLTRWEKWYCLGTLAAAYAELGDYRSAVSLQKQALASTELSGSERQSAQHRLERFQRQEPVRDTIPPD